YTARSRSRRRGRLEVRGYQATQQLLDGWQPLVRCFDLPAEAQLVRPVEPIAFRLALDQLQQLQRLDLRALGEAEAAAVGARLDLRDADLLCEQLQRGNGEQSLQRRRQ